MRLICHFGNAEMARRNNATGNSGMAGMCEVPVGQC
jgi:hypothetical protein